MTTARPATPEDAEELVRLRAIMLDSLRRNAAATDWQPPTLRTLREQLADPEGDFRVTVVDDPGTPGCLAACATGTIERRLGSPGNPQGITGQIFNVCTDPVLRRRGYSRACMEALLAWYRRRGVRRIDLNASAEAEPLYASLGFSQRPGTAMRLTFQDRSRVL